MKELFKALYRLERMDGEFNFDKNGEQLSTIIHCHVFGLVGDEPDIARLVDWFGIVC